MCLFKFLWFGVSGFHENNTEEITTGLPVYAGETTSL